MSKVNAEIRNAMVKDFNNNIAIKDIAKKYSLPYGVVVYHINREKNKVKIMSKKEAAVQEAASVLKELENKNILEEKQKESLVPKEKSNFQPNIILTENINLKVKMQHLEKENFLLMQLLTVLLEKINGV